MTFACSKNVFLEIVRSEKV